MQRQRTFFSLPGFFVAVATTFFQLNLGQADVSVGKPAPDFSLPDSNGQTHALKDFRGKMVVLEWYNKDCPYVRKHYDSGNMQKLQSLYAGKGVVWLSILSSAPGKEGYLAPEAAEASRQTAGQKSTALLLDPSGSVGKSYGAKTTPHMFVIDPQGQLIYQGAIDDNSSANPAVIPKSNNYVTAALDAAFAKKPVVVASTKPYGCGVKY